MMDYFNLYNRTKRSMPDLFCILEKDSVVKKCSCGNEYWEDKKATKTTCPICSKHSQVSKK